MTDPRLSDEDGRIAALRRYHVLDTAVEEPFEKITSLVRSVLGTAFSAVSLIDVDRQWFKSQQGLACSETPRGVSFCTHTIQRKEPLIVSDTAADPRFCDTPLVRAAPFIKAYAGVPLCTPDGYNIGALCAIDTVPRDFAPAQIEILRRFGALVIDELELRQIAQRDHLTGALSRRGFIQQIDRAIARYLRHGRTAAMIMIDVDHFKSINDRFGHPEGDRVLSEIARLCMERLRPDDAFGRIGGEEFAMLLAETDEDGAWIAAERVRTLIATKTRNTTTTGVTVSLGIASLNAQLADSGVWMSVADAALYDAKRGGRNRTIRARSHQYRQAA